MTPNIFHLLNLLLLLLFLWLTDFTCYAISGTNNKVVQCPENERHALLHFKHNISSDNCGLLSSWEASSLDCCRWNGVSCNHFTGHVTGLHLFGGDILNPCLEGTVSDSLAELKHLNYLDLSYNGFQGQFIPDLSKLENTLEHLDLSVNNFNEIPTFIWKINSLSYLNLNFNNLNGSIPGGLSNLKRLTYLGLEGNTLQLSRQFVKSLGKLCRLQSLVLDGNNLTYDFSEVMESLSCSHQSLVSLSLTNTQVWGSVPNISKFSSLKELHVDHNQLNGTISEGVGQLSNLEKLDLSFNNLNGVVSHNHFSNLSSLTYLDLSYTHALMLNLSADWTPPFQLDTLRIRSCKLGHTTFPKWLLTQRILTWLDISNTEIFDVIPNSFWTSWITSPESHNSPLILNMSNNMIHGVLPDLSFTFKSYSIVDLSSNKLSGAIPSFLGNASDLHLSNNNLSGGLFRFLCPKTESVMNYLDLSNNLFSETLPDCWSFFIGLVYLHLQNNNISGNLPPSIAMSYSLVVLHLGNNSLYGEVPMSWVYSPILAVLDLSHNSFAGSIPTDFGPRLRVLSLSNNKLSNDIPTSLCQLTYLQTLDLSSNQIVGLIPKCIYNFSIMANNSNFPQPIDSSSYMPTTLRDFQQFMWKRKEHSFEVSMGLLKGIDISDNNLQGQIPDQISSLVGIVFLNLSHNNLSGHIPSRIGQLTSLEFLDLSHNRLSGEIPTSLASIDGLAILDLSNNNLSGRIPLGTQIQGFNSSFVMNNSGLCGEPLPKCPGDKANVTPQNEDNIAKQKEHKYDDIFLGLIISVVLGFITGFWGVFGTLILKRTWRHALFRFYDNAKDKVYVMVVVNIVRACRRSSS